MKQRVNLTLFIVFLFSIVSLLDAKMISKFKSENEKMMWKSLVSNFLSAPGSSETFNDNDSDMDEVNDVESEEDEFNSHHNTKSRDKSENENNYLKNSFNNFHSNHNDNNKIDDKQTGIIHEDWLSIASISFKDPRKFPSLPLPDGTTSEIKLDKFNTRINEKYEENSKDKKLPPSNTAFWFRLSGAYLYYSNLKSDISILGSILISKVDKIETIDNEKEHNKNCFRIVDIEGNKWITCAMDLQSMSKWMCYLQGSIGLRNIADCKEEVKSSTNGNKLRESKVAVQKITQPLIIIPQPSRYCNQEWNYKTAGNDWECRCKDGKEQSPIDLPTEHHAVSSAVRPLFEYEKVEPIASENSPIGVYKTGEKIKILYSNFALRIFHHNFGKIVTINGTGYVAQEIVFKTPSEHTIDGQRYDMEMQVIHIARTKGDYGKKAILSFLFKGKPGIYNKFLDQLDFFNLPNPLDNSRDINKSLYIPHVLYESSDEDVYITPSFSFFTYQGSLTEPPCTENTIHYIASKPILLSITALQLFKEALATPDQEDALGNIVLSDNSSIDNFRNTQPLNGRTVFHYDSSQYGSPEFKEKKKVISASVSVGMPENRSQGHYEKREKTITEYLFINGNRPSGLPNSFVVTEKEAKGDSLES